jgi:1-deoxy-D-xylulose-5-phosphate reductoisomerase
VLNAANEEAVRCFLGGELTFLDIPRACRAVLAHHNYSARPALAELHAADRWARQEVRRWQIRNPKPEIRNKFEVPNTQ